MDYVPNLAPLRALLLATGARQSNNHWSTMNTHIHRRRLIQLAAVAGGSVSLPAALLAQSPYPSQAVKLVVPFTAGSTSDVIARIVGERLQQYLGQPCVVDNRAGAGGTIGTGLVATSAPDGHTALIHSAGLLSNGALYPALKYDTLKDLAPVTMLASMPNVFVVTPNKGFASLQDLVRKALAEPDKYTYGSSGSGSGAHLAGEKFRITTGIQARHIPYKGTPQALTDVMGGLVDWFLCPLALAVPLVKDGKLTALSIGGSRRSPLLPNVPTIAEAGFGDTDYGFWIGMFLPTRTPEAVMTRLHAETLRALNSDEVRARLEKLGAEAAPMSQQQFAQLVRDETAATTTLIKQAGIRLDS